MGEAGVSRRAPARPAGAQRHGAREQDLRVRGRGGRAVQRDPALDI